MYMLNWLHASYQHSHFRDCGLKLAATTRLHRDCGRAPRLRGVEKLFTQLYCRCLLLPLPADLPLPTHLRCELLLGIDEPTQMHV